MGAKYGHGWLGILVIAGAVCLSLAGVEWVRRAFYGLAWWGYILVLDGYIAYGGSGSLIRERKGLFALMALASATFWFGWELVNLRIQNWHYLEVQPNIWLRWLFAWLAFATVLPGVLLTYQALGLVARKRLRNLWQVPPLRHPERYFSWIMSTGVIMLALPLIWPRIFFPLVWGFLVLVLEPVNYRLGAASLLRDWSKGDLSRLARLLLAGAITGLLWESWNFLSGPRWTYNLPYLASPRLFAMPLAGYLGFLPFALECYVFFSFVCRLFGYDGWQAKSPKPAQGPLLPWPGLAAVIIGAVAFNFFMLIMIDRYLVKGWAF